MAIYTGIGYSQNPNVEEAAREAAKQAKTKLNQSRIDLAIVFNTVHYPADKVIPVIFECLDRTKLIGASTSGLILSDAIETNGVVILAITSDEIRFETGYIPHLHLQNMQNAGKTLIENCLTSFGVQNRRLMLFFVDGLMNNITDLIEGMREKIGSSFPVIGLGSCDNFQFQKTFQYHNNLVLNKSITALLLGGRTSVSMSCQHGWMPLGKPRTVDRVDESVIQSIDGEKPDRMFENYFGGETMTLKKGRLGHLNIRYPLGFKIPGKKEYCLRNIVTMLDDGSVVCQDKIPEGSQVHLMISTKDSCIKAAQNAIIEIKTQLGSSKPKILFVFESLARYRLLGRQTSEEIRMIRNSFGEKVPVIGMCTYGEIFPDHWAMERTNAYFLHNNSIILLALT